jgi:ATP/ADP translocase
VNAPSTEAAPRSEQPAQTLPVSRTLPRGSWFMSPDSELLIVAVPVAAIVTGLLFNAFVSLNAEQQTSFAIGALLFVLVVVVGGGFLFACAISRSVGGSA